MVQDKRVTINLSKSQLEKIKLSSEVLGLSIGQYLKKIALKSPIIEPKFSSSVQQEFFRQLSGIANNLNQLTRLANENGIDFVLKKDLEDLRFEVNNLWQRLGK